MKITHVFVVAIALLGLAACNGQGPAQDEGAVEQNGSAAPDTSVPDVTDGGAAPDTTTE